MSLTISAAQVDALIANPSSITGYSSSGPIIITGAITHTQASNLNTVDATYIQATVSETTLANLANISVGNSTRSSLNKFSFTVSDTSSTATALSSAQAKTSVSVDASNVASITSSTSSSIQTLFTGTVPSGLGAVPITVSDTAPAATALEAINQFTTGKVTASATGLTGLAADVKAVLALADGVVQIAGNVNVVLTDTNIDAVDLNAVDAATTGTLTTSATTITGTGSAVNTALTSNASVAVNSIEGLDAVNAVLDDPSTTGTQAEAVAAVRLVMNKTTGKVTATISEGDVDSLTNATNGVTGTGHSLTMTVTDTGITAAELNALNATTTVNIVLDPAGTDNPIGVESSAYSDVLTAFQSSGLTGLSTAPVIVSGNISVAQANTLDALTSGSITATISNSSIAELNTLTGTGNAYSVVVGDITVNAADINSLVLKTTVAPTVNAVTTFTGTLDALNTF